MKAGLSKRFELIAHPDGGRGCSAFHAHSAELDPEIEALIAAIAKHYNFNSDDVAEMLGFSRRPPEYASQEFKKWKVRL